MTEQELMDRWSRWMHNSGTDADLTRVYLMATTLVAQRALFPVDVPTILADDTGGNMLHHAGLIYLHELARDSEGVAMETQAFDQALSDYSLYRSRTARPTIDPFSYSEAS